MRERPQRARRVLVAADRLDERARGALLHAGGEAVAVERPFGHQPVQVRMAGRVLAVGAGERPQRVVRAAHRALEHRGQLVEALRDDGGLQRLLVRQVLVDRRRADAQPIGDPPHREPLRPFGLEQLARGGDDLPRTRAEFRRAGSHPGVRRP